MVNTGFIMSSSKKNGEEDNDKENQRTQLFSNEQVNLLLEKKQIRNKKGGQAQFEISGMLYRTFSEMDLWQLDGIAKALDKKTKLTEIDLEAILCTYEGHTIFSIFWDQI